MADVTRLTIAQRQVEHYRAMAEFEQAMVVQMSEVLWTIVLELGLPPDAELGPNVLFGMYNVETVLKAVHRLTRPTPKGQKQVPKG